MPVPLYLYGPSFWIGKATSAFTVLFLQEDRLNSLAGELSVLLCVDEHLLDTAHFFMYCFRYKLLTSQFILFAALGDILGGVIIGLITIMSSSEYFLLTTPSLSVAKVFLTLEYRYVRY